MPLVRIDLPHQVTPEYGVEVGEIVHQALVATLNVPANDRFQVIRRNEATGLIIDRTYLGIERSDSALIVDVTLSEGRSVELKQAFYAAVADGLNTRLGLRREDVFISLTEVKKENWSFGNGIAQYA